MVRSLNPPRLTCPLCGVSWDAAIDRRIFKAHLLREHPEINNWPDWFADQKELLAIFALPDPRP